MPLHKRAKLLVAANELPFRREQSSIPLDVPSIAIHEVVAPDFTTWEPVDSEISSTVV